MKSVNGAMAGLILAARKTGERISTRNSLCSRITAATERFDSVPLVTLRKTAWKTALREWEWFMSGSNDVNALHPSVLPWWQPWADETGAVRHNYSCQFRRQGPEQFDQVAAFIDGITRHPFSRRNVITTWYSPDMYSPDCPITNCHGTVIQAFVNEKWELEIVTYQRSCDLICGVPHNWVQYWAFLLWVAHRTRTSPARLTWIGGDIHLYDAHTKLADRMTVSRSSFAAPDYPGRMIYTPTSDDFKADDFTLSKPPNFYLHDRAEMIV